MAPPRAPRSVTSFSSVSALLAGAAVGVAVSWRFPDSPGSPSTNSASAVTESPITAAPGALPRIDKLPAAEADAALAAYLALPPLAIEASEADIAARSQSLRALLVLLPSDQVARLIASTANRLGLGESRLRLIAITTWIDIDPPAAARWAAMSPPSPVLDSDQLAHFASEAALAWARTDFAAAYAWAGELADPKLGLAVRSDLLARLSRTDPAQALSLARAGDLALFEAACVPIFHAWLDHDPAAAFAALGPEVFSNPDQRSWHLPRALSRWAARDPEAAFAWFDAQGLGRTYKESRLAASIVTDLAAREPPPDFSRLADLLGARAARGLGQNELAALLRAWMPRDSSAAFAWLDTLPDAALRAEVLNDAIHRTGHTSPQGALALASHLPEGASRDQKFAEILAQWGEHDPDIALAWLDSPEGEAFSRSPAAQAALIGALAQQDPAAALARWQTLASEELRRATASAIARSWAATEPDAATAWLFAQIPAGPHLDDRDTRSSLPAAESGAETTRTHEHWTQLLAFKHTSAAWVARDPAGYLAWAESQPSPAQQRAALFALAWPDHPGPEVEVPDPRERLTLLSTLRDADTRRSLQRGYLAKWIELDPAAARRWAAEHAATDLLPAPKRNILEMLGLPFR